MVGSDQESASWTDDEIEGAGFSTARLGERLRKVIGCLDRVTGQPTPLACED